VSLEVSFGCFCTVDVINEFVEVLSSSLDQFFALIEKFAKLLGTLFVDVDFGVGIFSEKIEGVDTLNVLNFLAQSFVLGAESQRLLQLLQTF
jgi:hypothetical protein